MLTNDVVSFEQQGPDQFAKTVCHPVLWIKEVKYEGTSSIVHF